MADFDIHRDVPTPRLHRFRHEPRHSSPKSAFESLSEWGFTRPVSTILEEDDTSSCTSTSSSLSSFTTAFNGILEDAGDPNYVPTEPPSSSSRSSSPHPPSLGSSGFNVSSCSSSSSSGALKRSVTNFKNVRCSPRRKGRRIILEEEEEEPEPVEHQLDVIDNDQEMEECDEMGSGSETTSGPSSSASSFHTAMDGILEDAWPPVVPSGPSSSSSSSSGIWKRLPRRKGRRIFVEEEEDDEPEPVENLFDVFDNDPTHQGIIKCDEFVKKHFGKTYGRPKVFLNRAKRNEIAKRFWRQPGQMGTVKLAPFTYADVPPPPLRYRRGRSSSEETVRSYSQL